MLIDVTMPQMGVSVAEGTVVAWRVAVGEPVAANETVCEISTDKIDSEVPAPVSGVVAEILVAVGETVPVGAVLARVEGGSPVPSARVADPAPSPGAARLPATPAPRGGNPATNGRGSPARGGRYSPVVGRIAAEHGIDLTLVTGTGRDGRVRKQDVLAYLGRGEWRRERRCGDRRCTSRARTGPSRRSAVGPCRGGLSRVRRQIGEHMKRSLETAATCTTWIEVDMSRVERARAPLRLTALAFVARACVAALREHPALNAWLEGEDYVRHDEVHLGIACRSATTG